MADTQTKQEFIDVWNGMLPDGVVGAAEKPIPAAPTIETPTTEEAANIAQGVLAKYLLDFFNTFEGLTPVDLILHIGQRNAVNKALLLASIEQTSDKGGKHDISIIQPAVGTFDLSEELLTCEVELFGDLIDLEEVFVTLEKPDHSTIQSAMVSTIQIDDVTYAEKNHLYTQLGLYDVGEYSLTFSATVAGYTFDAGPITIVAE
ncbi:MAG: hypothetical protein PVH19_00120 [Planctomycetia bacterium]|jgi:hypothetical protein